MTATPRPRSNGLVLVILAGLVVVGAGAAGWFLFNTSDPPPIEEAAAPAPAPEPAPIKTSTTAPRLDPEAKVEVTTDPAPAKLPTREYYVDGKLIRDHRPEGTPQMDLPPIVRPPDARKMQAQSTSVITKAVRLVMRECVKSIPPEERVGDKPKMEAVVVIAVKDKTATVTKATLQLRDVRGSATDAAKSCIENKILAVTEGVDEADLESYEISTSLVF